jgi:hypothetical protein
LLNLLLPHAGIVDLQDIKLLLLSQAEFVYANDYLLARINPANGTSCRDRSGERKSVAARRVQEEVQRR